MKPLEKGIEDYFQSKVNHGDLKGGLEIIKNFGNRIPSYAVIRTIIFKILDETDNKNAISASAYLQELLRMHPPNTDHKQFYMQALIDEKSSFPTLWQAFCYFVESCFCHYKIYRTSQEDIDKGNARRPVPHPNCDILVDFYVEILIQNYGFFFTDSEEKKHQSTEKSLVAELFWPSTNTVKFGASDQNPQQFLKWINAIYEHHSRIQKVVAFDSLQKLLNLMVKCIVNNEFLYSIKEENVLIPSDAVICNSVFFIDVVKALMNICKEPFTTYERLARFISHIDLEYLKLKMCEFVLHKLIYLRMPEDQDSPVTLKYLVHNYIVKEKRQGRSTIELKPKEKPKINFKMSPKDKCKYADETILHISCRYDRPGDLYEALKTDPSIDVNAKNTLGYTALHVASICKTELCARVLIEDCGKDLDWKVADENGYTALHFAVYQDIHSIAKNILTRGGSQLLRIVDKFGFTPSDYIQSNRMTELLKSFYSSHEEFSVTAIPEMKLNLRNATIFTPPDKSFKNYALYYHTLHILLKSYSHIFGIFDAKHLMREYELSKVRLHDKKLCPHYVTCEKSTVCSEDFEYLKLLPSILNHFITFATECSKKEQINLDLEIKPLKMFKALLS